MFVDSLKSYSQRKTNLSVAKSLRKMEMLILKISVLLAVTVLFYLFLEFAVFAVFLFFI